MTAFQPLDVEAYAWEAFTLVWKEKAFTARAIADLLPHRGYSWSEYLTGLRDLVGHGWVETNESEIYTLTPDGRKIREEAERLTDQYFFGAWSCLTESEIEELHQRMSALKTKLEGMGK